MLVSVPKTVFLEAYGEEFKREYPELQDEDIRQALAFAARMLDDKVPALPAHG
jgi:uncharacterized protein (DUF433 family)